MPTGYTSDLYEGKDVTVGDFILGCARAFGALVSMRDDAPDTPIPEEFEPTDYHLTALNAAKARLDHLAAMSAADIERLAQQERDQETARFVERDAQRRALRARYEAMLDQIHYWMPPTPEHHELKTFMIDQLERSIESDCGYRDNPPRKKAPGEWHVEQIEKAKRDVEYHATEDRKERERVAQRNQWVRALRDSLPPSRPTDRGDSGE
jgi:hypothetical protein